MTATPADECTNHATTRGPLRMLLWIGGMLLLIAAALSVLSLYLMRSRGDIPDVGEPFDLETFAAFSVPNDKNAISQYLLAQRALVGLGKSMPPPRIVAAEDSARRAAVADWSEANEDARNWLEANRKALEIWKPGTNCDEAIEVPLDGITISALLPAATNAQAFARLALLEASREASTGHAADAWSWYRATLRSSRHFCRHGGSVDRLIGTEVYRLARDPILHWSSRPELTAADLRQALADAIAADDMTPPLSETFKVEYLSERNGLVEVMNNLSDQHPWVAVETRFSGRPERMRRALKLFFANWIAHADLPYAERRPVSDKGVPLFEPAPGEAALPPPEILKSAVAMWLSGLEAPGSPPHMGPPVDFALPGMLSTFDTADRDRVNRAAVIVGLALQLYAREHGDFPAALPELVKAGYLKSVPLDPYGNGGPMHYRVEGKPAQQVIVWSVGLDGVAKDGKLPVEPVNERTSSITVFAIKAARKSLPGEKR
jgi:hypothetical protein